MSSPSSSNTNFEPEAAEIRNAKIKIEQARKEQEARRNLIDNGKKPEDLALLALNLAKMGLKTLPKEIGELQDLGYLDISQNPLDVLPPEIGHLKRLTHLEMNDTNLSDLPPEFKELQNLEHLDISHSGFKKIPEALRSLKNLKFLNLSNNPNSPKFDFGQEKIADGVNLHGIGESSSLETLLMNRNRYDSLPPEVGQLQKIKKIDISRNHFSKIPECIFSLENLQMLDASESKITDIEQVGRLSNLEQLALNKNQISELPASLLKLSKLHRLDLRFNALPSTFDEATTTSLEQTTTSLEQLIEAELSPQGLKEILLQYFQIFSDSNRRPGRKYEEYALKVIFLGQAGVGKTSVIKRLLKKENEEFNPSEPPTKGILRKEWTFSRKEKGQRLHLNFWELGGQPRYFELHRFFLTRDTLYVLVIDARNTLSNNRAEDWLELIRFFAGEDVPVIVIRNKTDIEDKISDAQELKRIRSKYPNIKDIIDTSALENKGISELGLEYAIKRAATELLSHQTLFQDNWLRIRNKVEKMDAACIEMDTFLKICHDNGVVAEEEIKELLTFLHNSGTLFYSEKLTLPKVFKPGWVIEPASKILSDDEIVSRNGILTIEYSYGSPKGKYEWEAKASIFKIMEAFELCCAISTPGEGTFYKSTERYLFPQLISRTSPENIESSEFAEALKFEIRYDLKNWKMVELFHASVLTRLILEFNKYISLKEPYSYWRDSIKLMNYNHANHAFIKINPETGSVFISVSGQIHTRSNLLAVTREKIDEINKIFGLEIASEIIHDPEHPGKTFVFEDLSRKYSLGEEYVREEYNGKMENFAIARLLSLVGANQKTLGETETMKEADKFSGQTIHIQNIITNKYEPSITIQNTFAPVYERIGASKYSDAEKEDLRGEVKDIQNEAKNDEAASESFIARRLRNIQRMAPDIADVILAALASPGAAVPLVIKKIAEKMKSESQK